MHPSLLKQVADQSARTRLRKTSVRKLNYLNMGWNPAFCADVVMCKLSDNIKSLFGIVSNADHLMLGVQGRHIHVRRKLHAKSIIAAIPNAIDHIKYYGNSRGNSMYEVVGETTNGTLLLIGIKFIPSFRSKSKVDEAWITTSYILRISELKRKIRNGKLNHLSSLYTSKQE